MTTADTAPRLRARKVHAYAASFGDDLARELILESTKPADVVLDPFAGAATTLLQARILGRGAIGIDVDPVACLIARVVTSSCTSDELEKLQSTVLQRVEEIESHLLCQMIDEVAWRPGVAFSVNGLTGVVPHNSKIEFWFAPVQRAVIAVLLQVAGSFRQRRRRDVVELAISSSIIRKWPCTLSQAMDVDHSRPHRVLRDDLSVQSQLALFRRVFTGVIETLRQLNGLAGPSVAPLRVVQGDSSAVLKRLDRNFADYVLTSPPYFNAIDYPRAHQLSQWWLWPERDSLARSQYIGLKPAGTGKSVIERCMTAAPSSMGKLSGLQAASPSHYKALCTYVLDLDGVLGGTIRVLKPGKALTLVLANNSIRKVKVPVVEIVAELLERRGLAEITTERRQISSTRRRYPYGLKGFRGLMDSEYLIRAKKPIATAR